MFTNLRKQLSKLGINKAQAHTMTTEGYPAIKVRWNGDEEIFTGYDELNPFDEEMVEAKFGRFKDENIK